MFFHKYFSQKNEKERAKAEKIAKRKGTGKDDDEVEDDQEDSDLEEDEEDTTERKNQDGEEVDDEDSEEEAEIWKAMKATNPDLQPGGDDDIDDFSEDSEDSEDYSLDDDEGEEEEGEGGGGGGEEGGLLVMGGYEVGWLGRWARRGYSTRLEDGVDCQYISHSSYIQAI